MSGHSKWSKVKHQKATTDVVKGRVFTRLIREIGVAVRQGGADPNLNARLRLAMDKAREQNMPMENIERAIHRAAGGGDGAAALEEVVYEGYSPGGAAILVVALTDNRNRSSGEVRKVFERLNGKVGVAGSVGWLFEQKGVITVEADPQRVEEVTMLAIDLGAEDFDVDGSYLEVRTAPDKLMSLRRALEAQKVKVNGAEFTMVPKTTVPLAPHDAEVTLRLLDRLEELDDVQKVFTNAEFPTEAVERYQAAEASHGAAHSGR